MRSTRGGEGGRRGEGRVGGGGQEGQIGRRGAESASRRVGAVGEEAGDAPQPWEARSRRSCFSTPPLYSRPRANLARPPYSSAAAASAANAAAGTVVVPAAILSQVLSPEEFATKLRGAGIEISSKVVPGRSYRLRWRDKVRIWEGGKQVGYLCVGTRGTCSMSDEYISLYLNLALNEAGLLKVANTIPSVYRIGYYERDDTLF